MEKLYFKNFQFLGGIGLLLIGFSLFVVITGPVRYLGIVLIIVAVIYLVRFFLSNSDNSGNSVYKSRTREQLLKHQNKR